MQTINHFTCRRIYRLAEQTGHAFDARVYISARADGWGAEGALDVARRGYSGRLRAYRRPSWTWSWS